MAIIQNTSRRIINLMVPAEGISDSTPLNQRVRYLSIPPGRDEDTNGVPDTGLRAIEKCAENQRWFEGRGACLSVHGGEIKFGGGSKRGGARS